MRIPSFQTFKTNSFTKNTAAFKAREPEKTIEYKLYPYGDDKTILRKDISYSDGRYISAPIKRFSENAIFRPEKGIVYDKGQKYSVDGELIDE